ncbi:MAG: hypothetical protein ACP5OZ_04655 [Candidatus Woesearchaeota archaeon]
MKVKKQIKKQKKNSSYSMTITSTSILIFIIIVQLVIFFLITKALILRYENSENKNFEEYYSVMNLLIDSETKLSSATTKNILPNDEKFNDMFIMIYEEQEPTKFRIYSISYIKMLYNLGMLVNSKIDDKNFFIAYCPEINLIEVYESNLNNEILNFKPSNSYSVYKTGISCKNVVDNKERDFDVLNGIFLKEKTKLKRINFKILGAELANNIMKEYGVRANVQ